MNHERCPRLDVSGRELDLRSMLFLLDWESFDFLELWQSAHSRQPHIHVPQRHSSKEREGCCLNTLVTRVLDCVATTRCCPVLFPVALLAFLAHLPQAGVGPTHSRMERECQGYCGGFSGVSWEACLSFPPLPQAPLRRTPQYFKSWAAPVAA